MDKPDELFQGAFEKTRPEAAFHPNQLNAPSIKRRRGGFARFSRA